MAEAATALEQAKLLTWGTYGPGAVEAHETQGTPLPPLTFKPLGECDTDHLEAILAQFNDRVPDNSAPIAIAITLILEDRRVEMTDRRGAIRAQRAKAIGQGTEE